MAVNLRFYPLGKFIFEEKEAGAENIVPAVAGFLENPTEAVVTAEGFGGIDARVVRNRLVITISGTLDNPYVVLTAQRETEPPVRKVVNVLFVSEVARAEVFE